MNNIEFKNKLVDLVNNHATIYAYGCFGNKLTESLINTKSKQYSWWYTEQKKNKLRQALKYDYVVWAFDCVCMIKAILWGWCGNTNESNGGCTYSSNNVPDISADAMINRCGNISTDFNNIEVGEVVWLSGHIGVYIGNNQVVECTPAWLNKVQITNLSQRNWLKHGYLPWISYNNSSNSDNFLGNKGYLSYGDYGENVGKLCKFMYDTFPAYQNVLNRNKEDLLGNYYGRNIEAWIKEFQKRTNLEQDGCVGPITLAKLKEYGFKY